MTSLRGHRGSPVAADGPDVAGDDPSRSVVVAVLLPVALVGILVVALAGAVSIGAVGVDLAVVGRVVGNHVLGMAPSGDALADQVIWQLRMPRALLAAVVGAGLAVVGATLQAVVRNPLADPYILGVSGGAGLFAAASITLGATAVAGLSTSGAAFVGALLATGLVVLLTRAGRRFAPTRVVLVGATLFYLFTGLTSFLVFRSSDPAAAQSVLFWLLGSLTSASWSGLAITAAATALGTAFLGVQGRALNALVMGEEAALSLGIRVETLRLRLLVATSLLVGALVAVSGGIGFVGLVVPHIVRLLVGPDHRRLLPLCALVGAIYLVGVDIICRVATSPAELPVGVVTSVLGAPFFLWLLTRTGRGQHA